MRHTVKTVTAVSITLLALTATASTAQATSDGTETEVAVGQPPVPPAAPQIGEPAYSCPEYTKGRRVLAGEFQILECDVSPPQILDFQLYPKKINGETPRQRCEHYGGRFIKHRTGVLRCQGVDY